MTRRLGRGVDARFVETGQLFRSLLDSIGSNAFVERMRRALAVFLSRPRFAGNVGTTVPKVRRETLRFIVATPRRKRKRPVLSRKTTRQEASGSVEASGDTPASPRMSAK
jgi:hypothetical protein